MGNFYKQKTGTEESFKKIIFLESINAFISRFLYFKKNNQ
jgi:hypothetical protein